MLVGQVMARPVFTIRESVSFDKIAKILAGKKISGITVVNKKRKIVGVISEKDLLHCLFPSQDKFYKDLKFYRNFENVELEASRARKLTARKIMTKEVYTVTPDQHVLVACSLMAIHNIRRLPVEDKGKLVGIVTMGSLYKNYLSVILKK